MWPHTQMHWHTLTERRTHTLAWEVKSRTLREKAAFHVVLEILENVAHDACITTLTKHRFRAHLIDKHLDVSISKTTLGPSTEPNDSNRRPRGAGTVGASVTGGGKNTHARHGLDIISVISSGSARRVHSGAPGLLRAYRKLQGNP